MATTYNNLYLDIRQQLRRAGIEEATLEARELVCFGTNKSREELARDGGLYASPELEHRVRDLVRRHLRQVWARVFPYCWELRCLAPYLFL